jgi:orotate phosphoribosyltransferase
MSNRKNLFEKKIFTMHSGDTGHWKIECDALTDAELNALAYIISSKLKFSSVIGVPKGGIKIAKALDKYKSNRGLCLIVDDVLTTGNSMEEVKKQQADRDVIGVVLFARGKCPEWVIPLFQMPKFFSRLREQ